MRRALILAALAVPIIVLAQVSAAPGKVVETSNAQTDPATNQLVSYINAAQCAGANAHLEWNVTGANIVGDYKLYASTRDPATRTGAGEQGFCDTDRQTTPTVNAFPIGSTAATTAVQSLDVKGSEIIAAVNALNATGICDAAKEGTSFWVCAHLVTTGSNISSAVGKFILQVTAPKAPSGVSAVEGDGALTVSWTATTNDTTQVDHYQASATPVDTNENPIGDAIFSRETNGSPVRISGLTNGQPYKVAVQAFSKGGNASDPAKADGVVVPAVVEDYWDWYTSQGGTEKGGCASGTAGGFALAGVALLLALRRRTK